MWIKQVSKEEYVRLIKPFPEYAIIELIKPKTNKLQGLYISDDMRNSNIRQQSFARLVYLNTERQSVNPDVEARKQDIIESGAKYVGYFPANLGNCPMPWHMQIEKDVYLASIFVGDITFYSKDLDSWLEHDFEEYQKEKEAEFSADKKIIL